MHRPNPLRGRSAGQGARTQGTYAKTPGGLSLALLGADGFGEWLVDNIPHLHANWSKGRDGS